MGEESAAETNKWDILIRRTFGVPDILGAEVAQKVLLHQLEAHVAEAGIVALSDTPSDNLMESFILSGVSDMGAEGALDLFVSGLPTNEAPDHHSYSSHDLAGRAIAKGGWSNKELKDACVELSEFVLEQIKEFVASHPFQDEAGRYFS
jgi:hypothetical protein